MSGWTGPAELTRQLERLWDRGRILGSMVDGDSIFPLRLRLAARSGPPSRTGSTKCGSG